MDIGAVQLTRILENNPDLFRQEAARRNLLWFAEYMNPRFCATTFHKNFYRVLDMFAHGKIQNLIIQASPQHGKAIENQVLTPTPQGLKAHGDLKVGEYVFGNHGQPVRILWVSPKCEMQYRLTFSNGQTLECHGAHEWVVYDGYSHNKLKTIETRALRALWRGERGKRGSMVMYHLPGGACLEYEPRPVLVDAYTLGAWLGDGSRDEPLIHIGNDDVEIIANIPYSSHEHKGTTTRRFYFPEIRKALKPYYDNKHIGEEYIYNSVAVRMSLIAGLIDTDGYVYQKNGRITISNTNKGVIKAAAQILFSLGENPVITSFAARRSSSGVEGRKTVYQLCFNPCRVYPTRVPRKKIIRIVKPKKVGIVDIERISGKEGNCIQVEGGVYYVGEKPILTHNSEGSSRMLPAYMLGLNPDLKLAICSYAATIAKDFNRDNQRIIDTSEYHAVFPGTTLSGALAQGEGAYMRNSEVFEIVGHKGSLRSVGRGGALNSKTLDLLICDDLYKDAMEANSPVVRQGAWDWYTKVARTRLHNQSQQLIVFTRWHPEDIIGKLIESEEVIRAEKWSDLEDVPSGAWVLVNFEAIKTGEPTEIDPREKGEALWPERHSLARLQGMKAIDPVGFQCLYQGNPESAEGRLYEPFKTWIEKSDWGLLIRKGCYVDVADEGNDYTCAIAYDIYKSSETAWNEQKKRFEPILYALVTGIEYTDANAETTAITVPRLINETGAQKAWIESNNGGSQFEKVVKKKIKALTSAFYQGANKESRIITNAPFVNQSVIMPFGWENSYPKFYKAITEFLRKFDANEHDDGADCLTGIYEKEIADGNLQPYGHANRGVRVH